MNCIYKDFSRKRILRAVLAIVLIVVFVACVVLIASGTSTKRGIVTTTPPNKLNVRSDAGTSHGTIGSLNSGDIVIILGEKNDTYGVKWYMIEYEDGVGYVSSQYIDILSDDTGDDLEQYLTSQGFPESYKTALRELHVLYPNWVFKAQHIDMDFDYVVTREQPLSLIWKNSPSSWKSTNSNDYIWETNEWKFYEPNWNRASKEIVAYFMDPRNFLGVNSAFQFLEQSFDENIQTVEGVQQIIAGTFLDTFVTDTDGLQYTYATGIYEAGKWAKVNPYILAAMIKQEQGDGTNGLVSGNYPGYEGYFNFFNINAYGSTNDAIIRNGLWYAKGGNNGATTYNRPWNTRLKSIYGGAMFYADGYINAGQNTLYLKKFNVQGDNPFTHQYMTNAQGASTEAASLAKGYSSEMRKASLSFLILIFKNMPEKAVAQPTKDGSPNMKLSSLSVSGFGLTPEFNADTLEYMLVVPPSTNSITVYATAMHEKAVIVGTGTLTINEDNHVYDIVVTAENGDVRTYKLNVAKETSENFGKVTFSGTYSVTGNVVYGIVPNVTVATMKSSLMAEGSVIVKNSAGVTKDDTAVIASGDLLEVVSTNNMFYGEYVAAVKGDLNGDGKVLITDLLKVRNIILGIDTPTILQTFCGDIDGGGTVIINDLVKIRNHILGTIPIN